MEKRERERKKMKTRQDKENDIDTPAKTGRLRFPAVSPATRSCTRPRTTAKSFAIKHKRTAKKKKKKNKTRKKKGRKMHTLRAPQM
jgi:hypothetical protein